MYVQVCVEITTVPQHVTEWFVVVATIYSAGMRVETQ
jgi:hypothetical protein